MLYDLQQIFKVYRISSICYCNLGKKLISRFAPETGWADEYRFNVEQRILYLNYKNGRTYRYSFDGTLLNREDWEAARIADANGYQLYDIAKEKVNLIQSTCLDDYKPIMDMLSRALTMELSDNYKANAHRLVGEIYLTCNKPSDATQHFEQALNYNPRVGVKKLLAKLTQDHSVAGSIN